MSLKRPLENDTDDANSPPLKKRRMTESKQINTKHINCDDKIINSDQISSPIKHHQQTAKYSKSKPTIHENKIINTDKTTGKLNYPCT